MNIPRAATLAVILALPACVSENNSGSQDAEWQVSCTQDAVTASRTCRAFTFGRAMDHPLARHRASVRRPSHDPLWHLDHWVIPPPRRYAGLNFAVYGGALILQGDGMVTPPTASGAAPVNSTVAVPLDTPAAMNNIAPDPREEARDFVDVHFSSPCFFPFHFPCAWFLRAEAQGVFRRE